MDENAQHFRNPHLLKGHSEQGEESFNNQELKLNNQTLSVVTR
jgi:hypothetical protein